MKYIIMKFVIIMAAVLIPFTVFSEENLQKASLDKIKVIKISAQDERAVIKSTDRALHVIKVGDVIGESGRIIEIAQGRVVIEEMTDNGIETVIIRVENGNQTQERIKKVVKERSQLYAPLSTEGSDRSKSISEDE